MPHEEGGHKPAMPLSATPECEDFRGKYESGRIGQALLDRYFAAVGELLELAAINHSGRAIEIGCGQGLSTKRLRTILDEHIYLEASEYVHEQVVLASENNPSLRFVQESIYELARASEQYDIVFLLEVLEHLDYPTPALREVKRVLRPGGYLIAGVPREPLWRALNMARGKYLADLGNTPGHLNHWSRQGFANYVGRDFGEVTAIRSPIPWTLVLARKGTDDPTIGSPEAPSRDRA